MISVDLVPEVAYSAPWSIDLLQRMRMLTRGERAVAYFYEEPDDSTFRYRVYNMVQAINSEDDGISASFFFLKDLHRLSEIADTADLLVVCRTRYDHRVNHLISAFRYRGKRVMFDIDDFVFNPDYAHLIQCTLDQDLRQPAGWDYWFAYTARLGTVLKMCDGAITTNEYLGKRISDYASLPVAIVPNFLNRQQLEVSDRIFAARCSQVVGPGDPIRLGYFSGSPSHNRDFAMVEPALETLLQEDDRLQLVVAGYIDTGAVFKLFGSRVTYYPFQDFINLQRLVGSVLFNLAPLQYNAFTNCKSDIKYFEAAVVGTPSIVSPTFAYARAVRDGENGYIAGAHQWTETIRRAVAGLEDYQAMAEHSRRDALEKYAWYNQRTRILSALGLS